MVAGKFLAELTQRQESQIGSEIEVLIGSTYKLDLLSHYGFIYTDDDIMKRRSKERIYAGGRSPVM